MPADSNINFNEFQEKSKRTLNTEENFDKRLTEYGIGLCSEAFEALDHIKKVLFQGHTINKEKLIEELGDTLFYMAALCTLYDIKLSEVPIGNIEKLLIRYPDGFEASRSINRKQQ